MRLPNRSRKTKNTGPKPINGHTMTFSGNHIRYTTDLGGYGVRARQEEGGRVKFASYGGGQK